MREFGSSREQCLHVLNQLETTFPDEFLSFTKLGADGIARVAGLSPIEAKLANKREYSEPVQWLGTEERRGLFIAGILAAGLCVTQGGRFISLSGDADKGKAMQWLCEAYKTSWGISEINDIAIGDSPNDVSMLELSSYALLIRSPQHPFPLLLRDSASTIYSERFGPEGWAEGVFLWLDKIQLKADTGSPNG